MAIGITKSACDTLQKAIYTALGSVTTSTSIKVYDHIPQSQQTYPYIIIREMSEDAWGDKTRNGVVITVVIENYIQEHSSLKTKQLNSTIITALNTAFPNNSTTMTGYECIYHNLAANASVELDEGVYMGSLSFTFYLMETT